MEVVGAAHPLADEPGSEAKDTEVLYRRIECLEQVVADYVERYGLSTMARQEIATLWMKKNT